MNAKDLLQMNEQMIAFNALIKGDLAKEIKQAKDALDALGSAQTIAGAQAKVDSDRAGFEAYKVSVQAIFDETKASLQLEQENVDKAFADLREARETLSKSKDELVTAQDKLLADTEAATTKLAEDTAILYIGQSQLVADQEILRIATEKVTSREVAIATKLSAIKALAK